jgi:hypothetical protein
MSHELEFQPQFEQLLLPDFEATIPLDKTYMRIMLALDDMHSFTDTDEIIQPYNSELPDDTRMFRLALEDYSADEPIRVGEGGANYRTMLYRSLIDSTPRSFVKDGSLVGRNIYQEVDLLTMTNTQLLGLNRGTSQYLSARFLWDPEAQISSSEINSHYKLKIVKEAVEHWYDARQKGEPWSPRKDVTIRRQAESYLKMHSTLELDTNFYMEQSEDYCFARVYGLATPADGERKWPALRDHESDRINSMEIAIEQATTGQIINVNDHRVVQAIAMRFGLPPERFKHPDCVKKSWPRFWEFISLAREPNRSPIN